MYKLGFFVPPEHAEPVKKAIFETGAGKVGEYAECCWQTLGQGQFRPGEHSSPFIGRADVLEKVDELRVELVCSDQLIRSAVAALKSAHPYEEPAYDVVRLEQF
ncbi:MAG: NGG1p interacting factor NIF3 [Oleiphilus sp.]|nr:MAG: NGG1p interacting factor NIF3 [Oleiphilus sp.]